MRIDWIKMKSGVWSHWHSLPQMQILFVCMSLHEYAGTVMLVWPHVCHTRGVTFNIFNVPIPFWRWSRLCCTDWWTISELILANFLLQQPFTSTVYSIRWTSSSLLNILKPSEHTVLDYYTDFLNAVIYAAVRFYWDYKTIWAMSVDFLVNREYWSFLPNWNRGP